MMLTYDPTQKIEPRFPTKEKILNRSPFLIHYTTDVCSHSILCYFTLTVRRSVNRIKIIKKLNKYKF